jgi:signal transduction histidine kinase
MVGNLGDVRGLLARARVHPAGSITDLGHEIMKRKLVRLSQRYQVVLQKHLKQGPRASLQPARTLGRQAVALGLETLDVARIHAGALAALEASSSRDGIIERAEMFFTEATTPIEKTHRAALKANARLSQLQKRLGRRTVDLAASNRSLKQGITQREAVERALKERGEYLKNLLKESLALQKHLRRLTHQILSAHEDKRKEISRDLQDEIAQTLLGINVRLLTLKKEAAVNARSLRNEIASTQRLVHRSVKSIHRFARKFGNHHEK